MTDRRKIPRRGVAAVEFAVVAPLAFLLFFAAYEFSRMNMIRHTLEMAAYEGARRGMVPGATAQDATKRAQQVLSAIGTRSANIVVTPSQLTAQSPTISVDISVPLDDNSWVVPNFLRGIILERTFTLARENVTLAPDGPPTPEPPTPPVTPTPKPKPPPPTPFKPPPKVNPPPVNPSPTPRPNPRPNPRPTPPPPSPPPGPIPQ